MKNEKKLVTPITIVNEELFAKDSRPLITPITFVYDAPQAVNSPLPADADLDNAGTSEDSKRARMITPIEIVPCIGPCPVHTGNGNVEYINPEPTRNQQLGFPSAVTANANKTNLLPPLNIHTGPYRFDKLETYCVVDDGTRLIPVPPEEAPHIEEPILAKGKGYVARRSGLYCTTKSGEDVFVSNARLEITGFVRHITQAENRSTGFDTLKSVEGVALLPDGRRHDFVIEESSYKTIYAKLRKDFPDINVHTASGPGIENYLTDIYTHARNIGIQTRYTFEFSGWYEISKGYPEYHIGTNPELYSTSALANLIGKNHNRIFNEGSRFLQLGDISAIGPIWLFFHAAFSNFFYKKAGCGWGMTMVIEGETGSKKTSVMKLLADPLNADRMAGIINIEHKTTEAGLLSVMNSQFRDNFVCLDDYTGMALQEKASANLADMVFRLAGDGSSRIKAKGKGGTARQTANCVFVLTAEKNFDLTESSHARYVRVFFNKQFADPSTGVIIEPGTIDLNILTHFQHNPHIIREYLTLYLHFLEENGPGLVDWMKLRFIELRAVHSGTFDHDRLTDAAAHLTLQAELIARFAVWCGCTKDEASAISHCLTNNLADVISQQDDLVNEKSDVDIFWETLETRTDLRKELAETERIWLEKPSGFLGFREDETRTLWINYDLLYDRLSNYALAEEYPVPEKKPIPQHLYEAGYSKAVVKIVNGKKKFSYLIKSKKGTSAQRRSMLVLYEQKVNEKFCELQKEVQ